MTISRLAAWLAVGAVLAGPGVPRCRGLGADSLHAALEPRACAARSPRTGRHCEQLRTRRRRVRERGAPLPDERIQRQRAVAGARTRPARLRTLRRRSGPADRGLRLLARLRQRVSVQLADRSRRRARHGHSTAAAAAPPHPRHAPRRCRRRTPAPAPTPVAGCGRRRFATIKRTSLAGRRRRVTIEMDGEALYPSGAAGQSAAVFFDLRGARASASLQDATLKFTDDVVREIRLGRHPQNTTRVVMDMDGVESYSVFTLYNPYRVVMDFKRSRAATPAGRLGARRTRTSVHHPPPCRIVRRQSWNRNRPVDAGRRRRSRALRPRRRRTCPPPLPSANLERQVLAGASARARHLAHRHRRRPRRSRPRRARQRRHRGGADARRRAAASEAAREAARHRGRR